MIKIIKYFFEAFFIYLFFLIAKLIGVNFSRKIFSSIFKNIGPLIRPNTNSIRNLNKFSKNFNLGVPYIKVDGRTENWWGSFAYTVHPISEHWELFKDNNLEVKLEKNIIPEVSAYNPPEIIKNKKW